MAAAPTPLLPFLPFALPEIGDEEIAEVVDTLKSGWVTTGPKAKRFEADFSAFLGDPGLHSIAVNMTINFLKKRNRRQHPSLNDPDSRIENDPDFIAANTSASLPALPPQINLKFT